MFAASHPSKKRGATFYPVCGYWVIKGTLQILRGSLSFYQQTCCSLALKTDSWTKPQKVMVDLSPSA